MEEKKKKCSKCLDEKLLEEFSKNKARPDGHESRCKDCMKKKMKDYRDLRAGRSRKSEARRQKPGSLKSLPAVTRATPEQIIADLRRGVAVEIIDMIQEKFGL